MQEAEISSTEATGQAICIYNAENSDRFVQISVIQTQGMPSVLTDQGESAAIIYQTTKDNAEPMQEVSGLGDDAFWGTPGLHVLAGDTYFTIGVGNTNDPANLELARGLAEIVLSKL